MIINGPQDPIATPARFRPPDGITLDLAAKDPKARGIWRDAVVEAQITMDVLMLR